MQVMKVTLFLLDMDGIGVDGVKDAIENAKYQNRVSPEVKMIEVRDIGQWCDEHPLNRADMVEEELRRLFDT